LPVVIVYLGIFPAVNKLDPVQSKTKPELKYNRNLFCGAQFNVMKLIKNIRLSWKALLLQKIRTFFAIIILAIGISTIMVLTSISKGAEIKISEQFGSMGTNLIIVSSGKIVKVIGRQQKINQVTTLTLNDADTILIECSLVGKVVPSIEKAVSVKYGNVSQRLWYKVFLVPEKKFAVIQGRFLLIQRG
jgi:hypothetical protein